MDINRTEENSFQISMSLLQSWNKLHEASMWYGYELARIRDNANEKTPETTT